MSPSKATAKKAARYNLIVVAVVLVFGIWAVNKAQSVDSPIRIVTQLQR